MGVHHVPGVMGVHHVPRVIVPAACPYCVPRVVVPTRRMPCAMACALCCAPRLMWSYSAACCTVSRHSEADLPAQTFAEDAAHAARRARGDKPAERCHPAAQQSKVKRISSLTSPSGLGAPLPHLRQHWAHPGHICTGTTLRVVFGPQRADHSAAVDVGRGNRLQRIAPRGQRVTAV